MKLFFVFSLIGALFACGSTDGAGRIAVNTMEGGDWEVAVFDLETQILHMVTDNTVFDWGGTWSPDGTTLAFASSYLEGEIEETMQRNEDGIMEQVTQEISAGQSIVTMSDGEFSLSHLTASESVEDEPAWSPDGKTLAFSSDQTGDVEIFRMDAAGNNTVQLTDSVGEDWHPDWSPDNSKIAFTSNRDLVGDANANWELYVMDVDGSNVKQLTQTEEHEWRPVWSPSGEQLAFAKHLDGSSWDIYVMDRDGGNVVRLTEGSHSSWEPVWSPDGTRLAFGSNQSGDMEVYLMNADGSGVIGLGIRGIPSDWTSHG